jgi:glycine/D-amino acid oxidase-like deaminating enzyme
VLTLWHHFLNLARVCGRERATWLCHASSSALDDIRRFCATHARDADFQRQGWLWAATNDSQIGAWNSTLTALEAAGESPFVKLPADEIPELGGSTTHRAGVFEATAGSVQPARLAFALRTEALRLGVRVFERTPMQQLRVEGAKPEVRSPAGTVHAERVVLAINAWAAGIPSLRRAIAVMGSDIVITEEMTEGLDSLGVRRGLCISDSRLMVNYYRRTGDDRLAFGKGGGRLGYGGRVGAAFSGRSRRERWVAESLGMIYPSLSDTPIAQSWTGPIDRTYDGLPFFAALGRPDVLCGGGYSGNGVGPTLIGGRILASLALGVDDQWANCGLVRKPPRSYPPEPVRYLGGQLVRRAVERKERAEDKAVPVGKVDQVLTSMAPSGLVPTQ